MSELRGHIRACFHLQKLGIVQQSFISRRPLPPRSGGGGGRGDSAYHGSRRTEAGLRSGQVADTETVQTRTGG